MRTCTFFGNVHKLGHGDIEREREKKKKEKSRRPPAREQETAGKGVSRVNEYTEGVSVSLSGPSLGSLSPRNSGDLLKEKRRPTLPLLSAAREQQHSRRSVGRLAGLGLWREEATVNVGAGGETD